MAWLTIAGIDLEVQVANARRAQNVEIGTRSRAFAGNMRSGMRAEFPVWEFITPPLTPAAITTLRAAIEPGKLVTCSGTMLGGSYTCAVTITEETRIPDAENSATYQATLALHIEKAA